jgi:hypothetical protein
MKSCCCLRLLLLLLLAAAVVVAAAGSAVAASGDGGRGCPSPLCFLLFWQHPGLRFFVMKAASTAPHGGS